MKIMHVVRVAPLSRIITKETLSYFTSKPIYPGSIVKVPLRNKTANALVLSSEPLEKSKIGIKRASYKLKKIADTRAEPLFLPHFIKVAEKAARYFATSSGAVITTLTPQAILKRNNAKTAPIQKSRLQAPGYELLLFQAADNERIAEYKSIVREEFARGHSVFFCMPTVEDVERVSEALQKGIEQRAFVLHGSLPEKEITTKWNEALKNKNPVLIIATGIFLSLPRNDIGAIIVEREAGAAYKTARRPFLDIRTCAKFLAQELDARFIVGDMLLRVETLYHRKLGKAVEFAPLVFRSLTAAQQEIIDKRPKEEEKTFTHVSAELEELLKNTLRNNERSFVFVSRRGLHPITVCADCESVFTCPNCSAPSVLHGKSKQKNGALPSKNFFLCHKCGKKEESPDHCLTCGSWRLKMLGIGTAGAEEELRKRIPDANILRIDKDKTRTRQSVQKTIQTFKEAPSAILVGTEQALPYLPSAAAIAVLSIDSLFAIPDFKMNERIFHLLMRLRAKAVKHFLIQTRVPDIDLFSFVAQGNMLDFYRNELKERKRFIYPPFVLIIKLSVSGTKARAAAEMKKVENTFKDYGPEIFPAFIPSIKRRYVMNAVLRVQKSKWPDEKLLTLLKTLPPSVSIQVDPESIL